MNVMDNAKVIHLVGIGGCGMSAIAKILHEMGRTVQGSDMKESPNTIRLRDQGMKVFIGHSEFNVRGADVVIYSSAVPKDNIEMSTARSDGLTILTRAEALSWILDQSPTRITVAGTHGKTTTTSMIATMMSRAGLAPTFIVGAEADTVTGNAQLGGGRFAIAEADESDGSFLKLHPTISVITNVEPDHMEHYKTLQKLMDTFDEYLDIIPDTGVLVINSDHANDLEILKKVRKNFRIVKFGLNGNAEIQATDIRHEKGVTHFKVRRGGGELGEIALSIPGEQNVVNALSAIAVGLEVGMNFESIREGLGFFKGVKRRFQIIGDVDNVMIIDDYAHHPSEIAATLRAARQGWKDERRIICVFQPHRYSRTKFLHDAFKTAFSDADLVIITDIYSAGEAPIEGVTGKLVADAVSRQMGENVRYIQRKEAIVEFLLSSVHSGDMVITAGAGDIHTVGRELYARLKSKV